MKVTIRTLVCAWVLAVVLLGMFLWSGRGPRVAPEPVSITYCDQFRAEKTELCKSSKTLRIPVSYYAKNSVHGKEYGADGWHELIVAYPGMKPWRQLSKEEQAISSRLSIRLIGKSADNVNEIFQIGAKLPQAEKNAAYGLAWHENRDSPGMTLIELRANPRVTFDCTRRFDDPQGSSGNCMAFTFTDWQLKLSYFLPQALLPQWEQVNKEILDLINSFVVVP